MIELLEDVALFMTRNRSTAHLVESVDARSQEGVRVGVVLSLPVVIANLARHVEKPVGSYWLAARVAELGPLKAIDYTELTEERDVHTMGDELLGLILGDRREAIVEQVAARAELDHSAAEGVLIATAAGVLVRLADRHVADGREAIVSGMLDEMTRLESGGWGEWIETVVVARSPTVDDRLAGVPAPVRGATVVGEPSAEPSDEPAVAGPGDGGSGDSIDWRRMGLVGGALVAAALVGWWLVSLMIGDDERTDATGDATTPPTVADPDVATTGVETDANAATGQDGEGAALPAEGAGQSDALVVIEVPLDDPLEQLEGTGSALLRFDRVTGEICYEFDVQGVASPYDGHIHVGPAGVKGGIVVDFGELSGRAEGCLDSEPVDTEAILADVAGHYVEFHDADEVNTVRAQLAEASMMEGDVPEADPDAAEGGAVVVISDGAVTLSGEVPDQVTIDKFVESFADIDFGSTELVNDLTIVPGAPRPSGNIVVGDGVFFALDSDRISGSNSVLDDLATIVRARPAWSVTVVGHTDDIGGDVYNLELSLRRAEAVRAALIDAGVAADALTVKGAGSTEPVADNDTAEGRARNRRIELQVEAG